LPASTAVLHRTLGVQYYCKNSGAACFQEQSTRGELKLHGFFLLRGLVPGAKKIF
jgi:hypothetical protein